MTAEQIQGLIEYIPTKDEKKNLRKYMTSSNKDSAILFDELCECEKFMVAMMTVKHSKEKVRATLFKLQFQQCVMDLEKGELLFIFPTLLCRRVLHVSQNMHGNCAHLVQPGQLTN